VNWSVCRQHLEERGSGECEETACICCSMFKNQSYFSHEHTSKLVRALFAWIVLEAHEKQCWERVFGSARPESTSQMPGYHSSEGLRDASTALSSALAKMSLCSFECTGAYPALVTIHAGSWINQEHESMHNSIQIALLTRVCFLCSSLCTSAAARGCPECGSFQRVAVSNSVYTGALDRARVGSCSLTSSHSHRFMLRTWCMLCWPGLLSGALEQASLGLTCGPRQQSQQYVHGCHIPCFLQPADAQVVSHCADKDDCSPSNASQSSEQVTAKRDASATGGWQGVILSTLPVQRDASSCGIFMVTFAELLLRGFGPPFCFSAEDVPDIRMGMAGLLLQSSSSALQIECPVCTHPWFQHDNE
jgi:hypothetical protein